MRSLMRPRVVKLQPPLKDYADPRDVDYAVRKYKSWGFDFEAAEAASPELREQMGKLLAEVEPMLRGTTDDGVPCLNVWGLGMDDVQVLPLLRNVSMVRQLDWPPKVLEYVEKACAKANVELFTDRAC